MRLRGALSLLAAACLAASALRGATPTPVGCGTGGRVLMVLDDPGALNPSDTFVRERLINTFGYAVTLCDDDADELAAAAGVDWVYISTTCLSTKVSTGLRDLAKPILNNESNLTDELRLGQNFNYGTIAAQSQLNIVDNGPLAGGATGLRTISSGTSFHYASPAAGAQVVATVAGNPSQACIFYFPQGGVMAGGFIAPAKRLGYFLDDDTAATLDANGLALFDLAVQWIICTTPATPVPTLTPTAIPVSTPYADPFDNASLAPFWTARDIGQPVVAGSQVEAASLSVTAGGCDIWDYSDQFRYVFQPATGDFDVSLRINRVPTNDPWSKAGLMLRTGEEDGAPFAMMGASLSNDYFFLTRSSTSTDSGALSGLGAYSSGTPGWVRLRRVGGTVYGYYSSNGSSYSLASSASLSLPSTVLLGVAVTSRSCGATGLAELNDFALITPTHSPTVTVTLSLTASPSATPTPTGSPTPTASPTRTVTPCTVRPVCPSCTYTTIAAALAVAAPCDTIELQANIDESVILNQDVAEIRGTSKAIVWTRNGANPTLEIKAGLKRALRIHDLTLRHQGANDRLIDWSGLGAGSALEVDHAILENASDSEGIDLAVDLTTAGQLKVHHNVLRATGPAKNAIQLPNQSGSDSIVIYNNIFYRWDRALDHNHNQAQRSLLFYNNTVDSAAIHGYRNQAQADVRNNVFTGNADDINISGSALPSDFQYNAFGQANEAVSLATNLTGTVRVSQYVSAGTDFHLRGTSDLRNRGTGIALVGDDLDGVARPIETAYEIGAYEYDPLFTPTVTPTISPTFSASPTTTWTDSPTPTASPSGTPTVSPTATPSPSHTPTGTPTATRSASPSATPTVTLTQTLSATPTSSFTVSPTATASVTPSLGLRLEVLDRDGNLVRDLGSLFSDMPAESLQAASHWAPERGSLRVGAGSVSWTWDGTGSGGEPMPNGPYELRLTQPGGPELRKAIWVEHRPQVAALLAVPNPARGAVRLYWAALALGQAHLSIFALSGERVAELSAPASAGTVAWDLSSGSGQPVAGGIYLVRLEILGSGQRVRQIFKLAVTR